MNEIAMGVKEFINLIQTNTYCGAAFLIGALLSVLAFVMANLMFDVAASLKRYIIRKIHERHERRVLSEEEG